MRVPLIAANWKMHKSVGEALRFVEDLTPRIQDVEGVEVVIAPPFTAIEALKGAIGGTPIALAAQNVHPEPQGAFTGEISVSMLADLGCRYVIVGHSERRHVFGEDNAFVAEKVRAVFDGGLRPILCVGERLEEREAGRTAVVVQDQLSSALDAIDEERGTEVVIAYEPVWAIGTGKTASPEMAQEVHQLIRELLAKRLGPAADTIRIQYGGSVKPENIFGLMAQPDIDGALVGGASLDVDPFYAIIRFDRPPEEETR
jgi:triosephosphate isomerase